MVFRDMGLQRIGRTERQNEHRCDPRLGKVEAQPKQTNKGRRVSMSSLEEHSNFMLTELRISTILSLDRCRLPLS